MVRIVRIAGAILLIIMIFLLTQIDSTYYIDINKNIIFSEPPQERIRDYTLEEGGITYKWRERHDYTKVDKLGTITLGSTTWSELEPSVILFLISLTVVGFLTMSLPRQLPILWLNKANAKRFWVNSSVLLAMVAYIYYVNVFGLHGGILFSYSQVVNLMVILAGGVFLLIFLGLANGTGIHLFSQPIFSVWLVISAVLLSNGFLIDHYSTTGGIHEGHFLQSDDLGIAIFEEERHNWTFGYTVFRITNVFLVLVGIAVASAVVSVQRRNKVSIA